MKFFTLSIIIGLCGPVFSAPVSGDSMTQRSEPEPHMFLLTRGVVRTILDELDAGLPEVEAGVDSSAISAKETRDEAKRSIGNVPPLLCAPGSRRNILGQCERPFRIWSRAKGTSNLLGEEKRDE